MNQKFNFFFAKLDEALELYDADQEWFAWRFMEINGVNVTPELNSATHTSHLLEADKTNKSIIS